MQLRVREDVFFVVMCVQCHVVLLGESLEILRVVEGVREELVTHPIKTIAHTHMHMHHTELIMNVYNML